MRLIRGTANAVLMVTLIKPMVRLTVRRWRKRMEESPAPIVGLQVQELFEAALIEELAPATSEPLTEPSDLILATDGGEGRSKMRLLLIAGIVIVATSVAAYVVSELIERRRRAQKAEADLVAVPIEPGAAEAIEDELEPVAEQG